MFKTKKAEEYQLKGGGALNPLPTKTVSKSSSFFKEDLTLKTSKSTAKKLPPVIKPGMALPRYEDVNEESIVSDDVFTTSQSQEVQLASNSLSSNEQQKIEQLRFAEMKEQKRLEEIEQLKQLEKLQTELLIKQQQEHQKRLQEEKIRKEQELLALQLQEKQQKEEQRQKELAKQLEQQEHQKRLQEEQVRKEQELLALQLQEEQQKEEQRQKELAKQLEQQEHQKRLQEEKIRKEQELLALKLQKEQEKEEQRQKELAELAEKQRVQELIELEKKKKEEQKRLDKLASEKKQKQQAQLDSVHQHQKNDRSVKTKKTISSPKKVEKVQPVQTQSISQQKDNFSESNTKIKTTTSLIRSYLIWWGVACFIGGAIFIGCMYYVASQSFGESKKMTQEVKSFKIKKGENPLSALNRQEIPTTWTYWFWSKFYNIKAGKYQVRYEDSLFDLLNMLEKGKSVEEKLRFEEGKNIYDLFSYLKNNNNVEHDLTSSTENQMMTSENAFVMNVLGKMNLTNEQLDFWGLNAFYNSNQNQLLLNHLEGLFFPDTFFVDGLITESKLLKQSFELMQQKMQKAWLAKANNLPYKTPYEALIMASLIEKESGENGERSKISGVFFNRLQKGMQLQTDPTAKYGVQVHQTQTNHILDNRFNMAQAVHTPTEYNTYTIIGLPPTPICLPSFESIEAALHPAKHDYLYFYAASGSGKTSFSKTLEEHNQKINADR